MAVALIKMFGFQLGYGYIADYIAEYFITLMQQKKCLSIFAGKIEKKSQVFEKCLLTNALNKKKIRLCLAI